MYHNVSAIVLRAQRIGEFDKRLSIYTREEGRLTVIAKGVCRPRAKLGYATEPAVEAKFRLWMRPGQSMGRVAGGGLVASFPGLRKGWSRLTTGLFLCEWTDRLTGLQQPHAAKYDLLRRSLDALESGNEQRVRAAFLVQFLTRAGYSVEHQVAPAFSRARSPLLEDLGSWDFSPGSQPPMEPEAVFQLEDNILKFVSPLLDRPLKTLEHLRELEDYRFRAGTRALGKLINL